MARPKIPRKSTTIDMTAMCDVAFLLLSFFILTTKFKPSEAVTVTTPSSVASKVAPEKDVILISITKDGKAFISMDDESKREQILNTLNVTNKMNWSDADMQSIAKLEFFGTPLAQLKQQTAIPKDQQNDKSLPGIPVLDTLNNQMFDWMRAAASVYAGTTMNLLVKGDNDSQFPAFKNVMTAFKKNELFKFQMVTNPESVPEGTSLWNSNLRGGPKTEE
ncbi:biopolymer transport protein ExbD [Filimonas zeae]|uniref:Biopolymer transporter ExbD n=1 Tax=Filimonas zeae TaxID=1737353 RepID=A0A917MXV9_9BACT|nr:biopolymer transporter ExbD [Filimonas zeae]MDR6341342.1 biopolymer transport protein ExbD [Filimonas zeae]GGH76263.1 biopolymer transporter ExbD [Filimonas zeae]